MTEQARPFKKTQNRIETLDAPPVNAPVRPTSPASVRAQRGGSGPEEPSPPTMVGRLLEAGWLHRETLVWVVIIALAVVSRLWDLAPRAFHHDESIHGVFSYEMFTGKNIYRYDPTWHGPVLYYMVTLSYFLLGGANEFSARFAPAMFGIGIIAISYFLRPLIGKIGAVVFAVLVLVSPSIMYYSRSLRHDIFATFGTLLFVVGLFRFAQIRDNKRGHLGWMALSGLGFFILFGSHEMSFFTLGIVLSWLGVVFLLELIVLPSRIRIGGRDITVGWKRSTLKSQPLALSRKPLDDDELDEPENIAAPPVSQLQLEGFDEIEVKPETPAIQPELEAALDTQENGERQDSLLGRFGLVYPALFGLLALLVVVGSIHLFVDTTAEGTLQKLFGMNSYFVLIPLYLGCAAAAAYPLALLINYGYNRLGREANFIARVTAVVVFLGMAAVAGLLFLRSGSPAGFITAVNLQFSGNTTAAIDKLVSDGFIGYSEFAYVGLKWPSLLPQLVVVIIVALLAGALIGWLWERRLLVYTERGWYGFGIASFFVLLIASLVSLRFVLVADRTQLPKGTLPLLGTMDKWLAYIIGGAVLALITGVLAGWFVSLAEQIDDNSLRGSGVLRPILRFARKPWSVMAWLLGFGILYILIFSNFFFSPERLADGFYRGIEYWGEQHGKRRLDQPWFYYPMLMLLYETFAVIFTFMALIYFPVSWWRRTARRGRLIFTVRGVFIGLTFWWSALALIIYSVAGEKIPWLNMQIALPFSLAAAAFLNDYLRDINWRRLLAPREGLLFAGMFGTMFVLSLALIGLAINLPKVGVINAGLGRLATDEDRTQAIVLLLIVAALILGLFGLSLWLWWTDRLTGRTARAVIVLAVGTLVFAYCFKSTIALNYLHPDVSVEPMIYTQTAPEVSLFAERAGRLSQDLRALYKAAPAPAQTGQLLPIDPDPTDTKSIPLYASSEVAWPLHWYFRDYSDVTWGAVNTDPNSPNVIDRLTDAKGNNYALILVSTGENTQKLQDQVAGQYTAHQYRFRWHFPEDDSGYGGLGYTPPDDYREPRIASKDITNTRWDVILRSFTEQPYAGRLWRYLAYREIWQPLQSFDMIAYVRNDLEPDFALSNNTSVTPSKSAADSLPAFDLTASNTAGTRNGQYRTPRNIAIAPNGDVLVLDSLNGRVQRFDKDGKFVSKFGTIGTGDGQFTLAQYESGPGGITIDEDGNIYVTDTWRYRIEKFDPTGKFLLAWGSGQDTKGQPDLNQQYATSFYGPRSIVYDRAAGELYITDTGNRRVVVYDKQGQFKRQFGSSGNGPAQFNEPVSLAISPDGKVYVADARNNRIQVLDKQGTYLSQIAVPSWKEAVLSEPYLTFDPQGNLYASDPSNATILRFDPTGKPLDSIGPASGLPLINPVGLAFDATGNLYIVDARRNSVFKTKA